MRTKGEGIMTKQIDINRETIKKTIAEFERHEGTKENVLKKVFSNSSNDNVEDVLIKVTLLNAFYSTQLYNNPAANPKRRQHADILSMAQHIANEANFDAWLRSNDWQDNMKAVNYIAFGDSDWVKRKEPKGANAINDALSFATKYCNWHCPDKYPIVDAVAKGMLYYISKNKDVKLYDKNLTQKDLKNYEIFCTVFNNFSRIVSERDGRTYSLKDIDKYLWQYGKDHKIAI